MPPTILRSKLFLKKLKAYLAQIHHLSRASSMLMAILILLSICIPILDTNLTAARYKLPAGIDKLIGPTNADLATKLSYDANKHLYQFNKVSGQATQADPSLSAGAADSRLYSADIYQDSKQGVTLYDNINKLSLNFTPLFATQAAEQSSNRIVYPADEANTKMIYTAKNNGLKEDLVLPKAGSDTLSFKYRLNLPTELEARQLNDGSIGVYSADPNLFGNISFGSSQDQLKIEQARTHSAKNHLAFVIPSPTIKQSAERTATNINRSKDNLSPTARFILKDNLLTVTATHLKQANYPLSIDPSFIVTSTSDWQKGNSEDNIDLSQANQLNRSPLTGGSVSGWTNTTSLPAANHLVNTVAYNGYYYEISGVANDKMVNYTNINPDGSLGSFRTGPTLINNHLFGQSLAYNGYLYVLGGDDNGVVIGNNAAALNIVEYSKINPVDGSLGAWTQTTSMNTARFAFAADTYNGRIYASGGCAQATGYNCVGVLNYLSSTEWATFRADGTLSAWTTANGDATTGYTFTTGRQDMATFTYNGWLYLVGGLISSGASSVAVTDILSSKIQANGSPGPWILATNGLPIANFESHIVAYNGYAYQLGNSNNTMTPLYSAINADGSLGPWIATSAFAPDPAQTPANTSEYGEGVAEYNGYIYAGGGCSAGCSAAQSLKNVQYAKVDLTGTLRNQLSGTSLPTPVWGSSTLVLRNFIYVVGGCTAAPTYTAGLLQPCPAANIIGHGADTGHAQGVSGDRLTIQFAHLKNDGSIDTTYAINGYTATNGWFVDKATCTESVPAKPDACPGSRYAFATLMHGGNNYYIISGRGGDLVGTSNNNALTADANIINFNSDGTPSSWVAPPSLTTQCLSGQGLNTAREFATAEDSGNFYSPIYVYGGRDTNGTVLNTVEHGGDSTTGGNACGWATGSNTLPNSRWQSATFNYNGFMYVVGGRGSGSTYYGDILKSTNQATSQNVSWSSACSCSGLPTSIYGATAFANKGQVYVVGGVTNGTDPPTTYSSTIYSAPIDSSGNIGTFTAQPGTLSSGRYLASTAYDPVRDMLFFTGGVNGSGVVAPTDYFAINNGGSGSLTWAASSTDTTNTRAGAATAQWNNRVYLVGGYNGSYLNTVQMGTIDQSSGVITWSSNESNTLPVALGYANAFAANGYLYVVGGRLDDTNGPDITNKIYRAAIDPNTGHLTGFVDMDTISPTNTMHLATAREGASVAVWNGYVYVMYGDSWPGNTETIQNDYQYASINNDGTLGSISEVSTTLSSARWGANASAYNGAIYVGDGLYSNGSATFNIPGLVIKVNSDHTLSAGDYGDGNNFRAAEGIVAYDGMVYRGGGNFAVSASGTIGNDNSMEINAILSNQAIGPNTWHYILPMPEGRSWHSMFAYNGRLYIVNGCTSTTGAAEAGGTLIRPICSSGTYLSTEKHADINSIARVAHYSRLLDSDVDVYPTKLVVNGSLGNSLTSSISVSYQTAQNGSPIFSNTQNPSITVGMPVSVLASDSTKRDRYYWLFLTIDDSGSASFPDTSQSFSNSLALYYHPNTAKRLKGGKTFTGGVQQGLDASP